MPPSAAFRVCVDARWRDAEGGSGVATHAATLLEALPLAGAAPEILTDGGVDAARRRWQRWPGAVSAHPRRVEAVSSKWGPGPKAPAAGGSSLPRWQSNDIFRTAQNHFRLTGRALPLAFASPPDFMHWSHPQPLVARGARNIYTIHDAIPLISPDLTAMHGPRHRRLLRAILRHADHLVTVSETARGQIIAALGLDPARITCVHPAAACFPADPPPHPRFAAQGYFLHVGRRDRRKNLPRLIAAHRLSGTRYPLLLVGPDGDETAILGIDGTQVVALGWLPAAALAGLIAHARGLLLPSLAEGFGLPIIEAMRLGTPVLTSDRGATAEIAGDAAILIDPLAVEAIAAGIARLDIGTETAGMVVAGRQRALNFSLERYANRLASLYRSLADNRQARA